MSFHQRLRHERLVKGWTIEQLSQASGVTVNRICMLERNLVEMVSENLMNCLAKALEVDFNAPPSASPDVVQAPVETKSVVTASCAPPVVSAPFALHLTASLQQQLETAAHAQGRSLHGEILARLEASLSAEKTPAPAVPAISSAASLGMTLSESDLVYLTEQVALRLQKAQ